MSISDWIIANRAGFSIFISTEQNREQKHHGRPNEGRENESGSGVKNAWIEPIYKDWTTMYLHYNTSNLYALTSFIV